MIKKLIFAVGFLLLFSLGYAAQIDDMNVNEFNAEMKRLREEIEYVGRLRKLYMIYDYVLNSPYGVPTKEDYEHN